MPRALAALLPGILVAATLNGLPPVAQSPNKDAGPTFEVASVKLNEAVSRDHFVRVLPGGQFVAVSTPLARLIQYAYGISPGKDFLMSRGPSWINSTSYDVAAKIDGSRLDQGGLPSMADVRLMTQRLLKDRFKLAAHHESRELSIYALVLARSDGKLGPLLRRSGNGPCAPLTFPAGVPPPSPPPGPPPGTSGLPAVDPNCSWFFFAGHATARQMTLDRFGDGLSIVVHFPIVDRTGLDGLFDLDLDFQPEQIVQGPPGAPPPPGAGDPNSPSIFTAVQEQLGLKLESTKGPVDVLVIDHVEKPTPD